ncbi:HAD hydrolase-like protein [Herbiconiux sp.]|uniref:HAD family hydrolase n=1 Tax=Herbiconiux sp. TaxID=1871186 RepID=UPI0025C3EBEB|nr:HAD hydrolase-like protein [Herbiconiux sp.]
MNALTGDIQCVLFDFDGTLIDSRPALVGAYRAAFEEVLGRSFPELENDPQRLLTPRVAEVCRDIAGDRADECVEAYDRHYRASTYRLATLYPGVEEMLAALHERGIRTGIVTNKGRARTEKDLDWLGIAPESMAAIICAEDTVERKPHPAPVALGIETAGFTPDQVVYVGDGPQDARSGRASGAQTVSVLYGYYPEELLAEAGADATASSPADLTRILTGTPSA